MFAPPIHICHSIRPQPLQPRSVLRLIDMRVQPPIRREDLPCLGLRDAQGELVADCRVITKSRALPDAVEYDPAGHAPHTEAEDPPAAPTHRHPGKPCIINKGQGTRRRHDTNPTV